MSLTTNVPIFPGFAPGQSAISPAYPVRYPGWSIKKKANWSNSKQTAVNGRTVVTKYWTNPLWDWEFTYPCLFDNPAYAATNSYFTSGPIPYTDYQILSGFYNAMQGQGNEFLFQPPDSVVGGTATITAVQGISHIFTIFCTNTFQAGQYAVFPASMTATFLESLSLQILSCSSSQFQVFFNHADYGKTSDSGTVHAGQLLGSADANNNTELIHFTGGYPTIPLTGTPNATIATTEAVQVINTTGLTVFANGSSVSPPSVQAADSIAPYQGLVLNFGSTPADPVVASYTYYYLCRFSEDIQEWENFIAMLWLAQSFKFTQVRI